MRKRLRLVLALALLGIASRSFAWDYPVCSVLHGTECEDGRLICDDGPTTGICVCRDGAWDCGY